MNTSEVLDRAADEIERRGWSQGTGWFPRSDESTPVCAEGALRLACGFGGGVGLDGAWFDLASKRAACDALSAYLTDRFPECINQVTGAVIPFSWNDARSRTQAEVIEVLRAAAMVERTREAVMAVTQ